MLKLIRFSEAVLGLLAAFVLGIAVPLAACFGGFALMAEGKWHFGVPVASLGVLSFLSSKTVISLAARWEQEIFRTGLWSQHDQPERLTFTIEEEIPAVDRQTLIGFMASHLPEFHWPFRIWCALYWGALLAASAFLGHQLCRGAAHAANNNATALFGLACVGHFAFLVAANLYLVLAAAVLTPNSDGWLPFYRARLLIDAAAVLISVALVFVH